MRVVVVGDAGAGKTSLVSTLLTGEWCADVPSVLPPVSVPAAVAPEGVEAVIVDTLSNDTDALAHAARGASALCIVYVADDATSFARVASHWLPWAAALGLDVPVVLAGNKIDLRNSTSDDTALLEAMVAPVMAQWSCVETCVECSARSAVNVAEVFYFALRAVLYPAAPLYDAMQQALRPPAVLAFRRIFAIADSDCDGALSAAELDALQERVFGSGLSTEERHALLDLLAAEEAEGSVYCTRDSASAVCGITLSGLLRLQTLFVQRGRLETPWTILRAFGYDNELKLRADMLRPVFEMRPGHRAELSDAARLFLRDRFLACDIDGDGALRPAELAQLLAPLPENAPHPFASAGYPESAATVLTDAPDALDAEDALPYNAFDAQWDLACLLDPKSTLSSLLLLGYPSDAHSALIARECDSLDNTTVHCIVVGAPGCGKTAILRAALGREFSESYVPTSDQRYAAVAVFDERGIARTLVLHEIAADCTHLLDDGRLMASVNAACIVYDTTDCDSFAYAVELRERHPLLAALPSVFVAAKADLPAADQRANRTPCEYCMETVSAPPISVSAAYGDVSNVCSDIVALKAHARLPMATYEQANGLWRRALITSAIVCAAGVALALIMRARRS